MTCRQSGCTTCGTGAATLALASHADLKVIQQILGHSSIVTADTYASVLPETAHRSAQATADMITEAARSLGGSVYGDQT